MPAREDRMTEAFAETLGAAPGAARAVVDDVFGDGTAPMAEVPVTVNTQQNAGGRDRADLEQGRLRRRSRLYCGGEQEGSGPQTPYLVARGALWLRQRRELPGGTADAACSSSRATPSERCGG
jgi:hypothetical protein